MSHSRVTAARILLLEEEFASAPAPELDGTAVTLDGAPWLVGHGMCGAPSSCISVLKLGMGCLHTPSLTRFSRVRMCCCDCAHIAELLCGDDAVAAAERVRSGGLRTGMWWAARAALLQQRLLARGAASLRAMLVVLHARTLAVHGVVDAASAACSRRLRRVAAAAQLEAALMEQEYRCARTRRWQ
jgi:hypothetical protein